MNLSELAINAMRSQTTLRAILMGLRGTNPVVAAAAQGAMTDACNSIKSVLAGQEMTVANPTVADLMIAAGLRGMLRDGMMVFLPPDQVANGRGD